MPKIDPSAKVHPKAELADDVVVGPFSIIDGARPHRSRDRRRQPLRHRRPYRNRAPATTFSRSRPSGRRRRTSPTTASRRVCSSATETTSASS